MTDLTAERGAPPPPETVFKERVGVIQWASLPRRIFTIYTPLIAFIVVLLFPFYWMTITTFKSNEELYNFRTSIRSGYIRRRSRTSTVCCSRPTIRNGSP